jgi:hypothetical protein
MGDFLKNKVKPGDWPNKVPASFFNKVDEVLSNLELFNGHVERYSDKYILVPDEVDFSHPFQVKTAVGLNVTVAAGSVKGLYDNGEFYIAESEQTLSNGTNYIGIRLEISYDLRDDFLIGSDTLSEYFHFLLSASVVTQTSAFTDTWSASDKSTGYRYIDLATVTAAGGSVTNIDQKWASDYNAIETAYTWTEVS